MSNELEDLKNEISAGERNKKNSYNKQINDFVVVHKMPKDVDKVHKTNKDIKANEFFSQEKPKDEGIDKVKIIGAVIIISGIFVLLGGSYLGYMYLIKPYMNNRVNVAQEEINKNTTPIVDKKEQKDKTKITPGKKGDKTVSKEDKNKKDNNEELNNVINKTATTTKENKELTTTKELSNVTLGDVNVDNDSDGLFNAEEELLGSSDSMNDSDGDTYNDKLELLKLYNPAGSGVLADNLNIDIYQNKDFKYTVIYPKLWEITELNENRTVMFLAPDRTYISVITQENSTQKTVINWYKDQFKSSASSSIEIFNINDLQGVKNKKGTIFYLSSPDMKYIYSISIMENSIKTKYPNILQAMVNSFKITK